MGNAHERRPPENAEGQATETVSWIIYAEWQDPSGAYYLQRWETPERDEINTCEDAIDAYLDDLGNRHTEHGSRLKKVEVTRSTTVAMVPIVPLKRPVYRRYDAPDPTPTA